MPGSKENSRALLFYRDVLGLQHLHYGLWEAGDEVSFANLKRAQERYQQAIMEMIPENTKTVLDVGCGTGELSKTLKASGYEVEGLSPDINHQASYAEKVGRPFHLCRFEDFSPKTRRYDAVIMSESCQYIGLEKLFPKLAECLAEGGAWIVADYFVRDTAAGVLAQSGHNYTRFQESFKAHGFTRDIDRDITADTTKTLQLAADIVGRGEIALAMLKQRIDQRSFLLSAIVNFMLWLGRKEIRKTQNRRILLDAEAFATHKTYRMMRFFKK